ncbi:Hypothetical predicted protein, partial [Paramuricea clavata]
TVLCSTNVVVFGEHMSNSLENSTTEVWIEKLTAMKRGGVAVHDVLPWVFLRTCLGELKLGPTPMIARRYHEIRILDMISSSFNLSRRQLLMNHPLDCHCGWTKDIIYHPYRSPSSWLRLSISMILKTVHVGISPKYCRDGSNESRVLLNLSTTTIPTEPFLKLSSGSCNVFWTIRALYGKKIMIDEGSPESYDDRSIDIHEDLRYLTVSCNLVNLKFGFQDGSTNTSQEMINGLLGSIHPYAKHGRKGAQAKTRWSITGFSNVLTVAKNRMTFGKNEKLNSLGENTVQYDFSQIPGVSVDQRNSYPMSSVHLGFFRQPFWQAAWMTFCFEILDPDKKLASIERMRANVLEKARERGLKIEGKINNHFNKLLKKEKRKAIGKEVKSAARQFQRRRRQTDANARKEIRDAKKWKSDIVKEEKRRRKEVTDWKAEAQKWKKETQRLRRNAKAHERRAEENRRIAEGKWKGKKKFATLQLKVGNKLSKIWKKTSKILKPILAKHAIKKKVKKYVITPNGNYDPSYFLTITEDEVKTLINSETEPRNVRMSLACKMVRSDPKTGEEVSTIAHFG